MRIPIANLGAMNASDLVTFALGLALIVGGLALIVGGGVALGAALGWNIARRVTRLLAKFSVRPKGASGGLQGGR
jgi:hypothetical protein